jgi:hypothetical protein
MNFDRYSKCVLTVIALALCALAWGRIYPGRAAAAATDGATADRNIELFPAAPMSGSYAQGGFVMLNRRTGDVAYYELLGSTSPTWAKQGPTGHIAAVGSDPTNTR